jgi:hypothetical protein
MNADLMIFGRQSETIRVARWYIFKPKITIWVYFGGAWNGKVWYSLTKVLNLEYFTAVRYILWQFGILCDRLVYFSPVLVCFAKKDLATLETVSDITVNHSAVVGSRLPQLLKILTCEKDN